MKPGSDRKHQDTPRTSPAGSRRLIQYAALAWRGSRTGRVEILLITSRETRRWVVPKGWPIRGLKPHQAAAREAWEEAGVEGRMGARKVGVFDYQKRLSGGQMQPVRVEVYPLEVVEEHDDWPEAGQRERRWFSPDDAGANVEEPGLARLLAEFRGREG